MRGPRTMPAVTAKRLATEGEPTILGLPAEYADEADGAAEPPEEIPAEISPGLTVLRHADPLAAGALVLAGVAANVSLLLSWAPGAGPTGLPLVQDGVEDLRAGTTAMEDVLWQPPVVVLCGGLLVLLGFLLLVPAHAHRLIGVLALVVSLAAAAAIAVLIAVSDLADDRFGPGMWCAVAVPVLGLLGALKAMLTPPRVTVDAGATLALAPVADDDR